MKKQETKIIEGITIDKVKPYQNYVATLHVKKADKIVNKVVVFMKTNDGIVKMDGWDENQAVYGQPNKIKISEKNNTIRLATKQDIQDFVKRTRLISLK